MSHTTFRPAADTAVVPPPPPRHRRTVAMVAAAGVVLASGFAFVTLGLTDDGDKAATATATTPTKDFADSDRAADGPAAGGSTDTDSAPAGAEPAAVQQPAAGAKEPAAKSPAGATDGGHKPATEFGIVTAVEKSGTTYTLVFDRAEFLSGEAAADYYAAHPDVEAGDYAIANENPKLRRYRLAGDAVISGGNALAGTDGGKLRRITAAELKLVVDTLPHDWQIPVHLTHNADGTVSKVREQYIP